MGGYKVYYGASSRVYQPAIPVGKATSYTIGNLMEGKTYYFAVTAIDMTGNESGYSAEVSKTIPVTQLPSSDTVAPTVRITSPKQSRVYTKKSTINISGSASDDRSVTKVTWRSSSGTSGDASGTTSWSISAIPLVLGENLITVTAVDAAENKGTHSIVVFRRQNK